MWKKILTWAKYIGAIGGALAIVGSALLGLHKAANGVTDQTEAIKEVQVKQEVILDSLYSLSIQVKGLSTDVTSINDNTVLIGNYVEGVDKAFSRHLLNSPEVSKEDYNALMQIVEELKKNDKQTALR